MSDTDGRIRFNHPGYSNLRSAWIAWTTDLPEGFIYLATLVLRKVNIGDKDGGIWEGVTVTALDERTGVLTVEGGTYGVALRDTEGRPVEGQVRIASHDIARGFVHPEEQEATS